MYFVSMIVYCALLIYIADLLDANDKLLNTSNKFKDYILWLKVV
jgi:hypothetical protein